MNKYLLIGIFVFASLTLVAAITVGYLSNQSNVDVSIESPLTVNQSTLGQESIYGGETLSYKSRVINNINKTIEGVLTLTISNLGGTASCEDFDLITLESETPEVVPTTFSCTDEEVGVVTITKPVVYTPFEVENYLGSFVLKLNIEPSEYNIATQVMIKD